MGSTDVDGPGGEGGGLDPRARELMEAVLAEQLDKMAEDLDISPRLALHLMKLEARIKKLEEGA